MPTDRAMEKAREIDNRGGHATDIAAALDAFAAEERRAIVEEIERRLALPDRDKTWAAAHASLLHWIESRGRSAS